MAKSKQFVTAWWLPKLFDRGKREKELPDYGVNDVTHLIPWQEKEENRSKIQVKGKKAMEVFYSKHHSVRTMRCKDLKFVRLERDFYFSS